MIPSHSVLYNEIFMRTIVLTILRVFLGNSYEY